MPWSLAPGESLLPGTRERLDALFAHPDVDAVLLPLVPSGRSAFARAARRTLGAWDRRFLHPQTYFAPASRVAWRAEAREGPRNADAVPRLAQLLATGRRIEAIPWDDGSSAAQSAPALGVASPLGDHLGAWVAHFRAEGSAWGRLAAREPRFRGFLPALDRPSWWRHNALQAPRRAGEIAQAMRAPSPLSTLLHLSREAAFTGACVEAASRQG